MRKIKHKNMNITTDEYIKDFMEFDKEIKKIYLGINSIISSLLEVKCLLNGKNFSPDVLKQKMPTDFKRNKYSDW